MPNKILDLAESSASIIASATPADDAGALSSEYANSGNGFRWAQLRINVDLPTGTVTGGLYIYIVYELDGSNYARGDASTRPPDSAFIQSIPVADIETAAVYDSKIFRIAPKDFKIVIWNSTGLTLVDLDVDIYPYSEEIQ